MTNSNNKPLDTLRDGALKVTIWGNPDEGWQRRHSVKLSRVYKDKEGNWQESQYFSQTDLLKLQRLADQAYDRIHGLRGDAAGPSDESSAAD